jgi:hypothetical protein
VNHLWGAIAKRRTRINTAGYYHPRVLEGKTPGYIPLLIVTMRFLEAALIDRKSLPPLWTNLA